MCLYDCSAYARLSYNLHPFCVLDYLYSVAVDASIPLLFSYRVYRDSATTGHVVVTVISVAVSPSSITSRLRLFFHIPSELLHDFYCFLVSVQFLFSEHIVEPGKYTFRWSALDGFFDVVWEID